MKRFLAFRGDDYYPRGGMHDFFADFDTQDEAVQALTSELKTVHQWTRVGEWASVWDSETDAEVWNQFKLPQYIETTTEE